MDIRPHSEHQHKVVVTFHNYLEESTMEVALSSASSVGIAFLYAMAYDSYSDRIYPRERTLTYRQLGRVAGGLLMDESPGEREIGLARQIANFHESELHARRAAADEDM